jgi:Tfp pilus assembly protein PilO
MSNLPRYLVIKDHPHLLRDTQTMGIINLDKSGHYNVHKRREEILKQKTLEKQQAMEINNLRKDVNEIKELLRLLLKKGE